MLNFEVKHMVWELDIKIIIKKKLYVKAWFYKFSIKEVRGFDWGFETLTKPLSQASLHFMIHNHELRGGVFGKMESHVCSI